MTTEEYKTHFSLWCMMAAPLMSGNDLGDMTPETRYILTNQDAIAIDQDSLGKQGFYARNNGDYEIWIKKLSNEEKAACLLNRSDETKKVQVDFATLLKANDDYWTSDQHELSNYRVYDIWEHEDFSIRENAKWVEIPLIL